MQLKGVVLSAKDTIKLNSQKSVDTKQICIASH
jgi:hypothetical protein